MSGSHVLRSTRIYTGLAILLTALIIALEAWLAYAKWNDVSKLSLADCGNLAGGSGTLLALVWLIFGYFQQGAELRLSTAALEAQQKELSDQVAAMQSLVAATESGSFRPIIAFRCTGSTSWDMINVGKGPALNVNVFGGSADMAWDVDNSFIFPAIAPNDTIRLEFTAKQGAFLAQYTDATGNPFHSTCSGSTNRCNPGTKYPELTAKYQEWQLDSESVLRPEFRRG